jgi:hypothetical protein
LAGAGVSTAGAEGAGACVASRGGVSETGCAPTGGAAMATAAAIARGERKDFIFGALLSILVQCA